MIRQPIVVLVGHVDHGKSSILETIKGISITKGEAGGITQCIKSYTVPLQAIENTCGNLLSTLQQQLTIPGLLFLDSPGHAAFNNMRKRGGNLADIAILVVDVNEGLKEQTLESLQILKQYKTPFIIALNKIDLIQGWRSQQEPLLPTIKTQGEDVQHHLETQLYTLVGQLAEHGFNAERLDRVNDYTQQVAIVPVSATTHEGLPELLMVLTGLAQKYLENKLHIETDGPGKGTILEITEQPGLGTTLDVVLYDGHLKANDMIVIGGVDQPTVTKVRGLFAQETGKQCKLQNVQEVHAACGVKICAPDIKNIVGGMPLHVATPETLEQVKEAVQQEIEEVVIDTDNEGVVVKADTIGSLEALIGLLKEKDIPIKRASIGDITKKDLAEARAELNTLHKTILGFNVKAEAADDVKVITNTIIYKIIEDYEAWHTTETKKAEAAQLSGITKPCQLKLMKGCVFRQSNPAVVGVTVQIGQLKTDTNLIKQDGSKVGVVKSIQLDGESTSEVEQGKEVAISIPNVIVGRQIKEDDVLYSDLTENEFKQLKELKKLLKADEIDLLKAIALLKRKQNPLWGA